MDYDPSIKINEMPYGCELILNKESLLIKNPADFKEVSKSLLKGLYEWGFEEDLIEIHKWIETDLLKYKNILNKGVSE